MPEKGLFACFPTNLEIDMKHNLSTAPQAEMAIRVSPQPASCLIPENARNTLSDKASQAKLLVSIRSHGLLENLVVSTQDPDPDGS